MSAVASSQASNCEPLNNGNTGSREAGGPAASESYQQTGQSTNYGKLNNGPLDAGHADHHRAAQTPSCQDLEQRSEVHLAARQLGQRQLDPSCQRCVGLSPTTQYGATSSEQLTLDAADSLGPARASRGVKRFGDGRRVLAVGTMGQGQGQIHHQTHDFISNNRLLSQAVVTESPNLTELRQDGYDPANGQPVVDGFQQTLDGLSYQTQDGESNDAMDEASNFDYQPVLTKILNEKKLALFNSPTVMDHLKKYYNKRNPNGNPSSM